MLGGTQFLFKPHRVEGMGEQLTKPKTSAERSREDAQQEQLDNMLGGAFGGIEQLTSPQSDESEVPAPSSSQPPAGPPSGPPSGPPTGPPTGPPSGPPGSTDEPGLKASPSGPPTGPPSGPPGSTDEPGLKASPSGPPTGPPSGPPTGPPKNARNEDTQPPKPEPPQEAPVAEPVAEEMSPVEANDDSAEEPPSSTPSDDAVGEQAESTEEPAPSLTPQDNELAAALKNADSTEPTPTPEPSVGEDALALLAEKEAELERLHMENARLRQSVVGASEVIEQMEEPPMPPVVEDNIVIPGHVVADFVRIGRQLDREHLVRATMGSVAMLHPEQPNVMISSRHMTPLPRMNERSLCSAFLGAPSPRGAPVDWHALEVVLASVSIVTGGPAAVVHMHGPHTTAASCEKDLIVLNPIDDVGRQHIGKIVVVDPDPDHPEDFLRQVAEALKQGGMRCVVIRGNGAYAVGADFDQAWANAAMLEHSMQVHLLARQANLKL